MTNERMGKKRGPVKTKQQITVRLDRELMAAVHAQLADDGGHVTDAIERALILWLKEARFELPAWTKQVRFVVASAVAKENELIRGLAIRMVENEVEQRSPEAEKIFELCESFLRSANILPHAQACLELYARRGKRISKSEEK